MKTGKRTKANTSKALRPLRRRPKPVPPVQMVHFELTNPSAMKVAVAGTFNNWQPEKGEMKRSHNKWIKDVTLEPGTYEYRLVVDGRWMADPQAEHSVVNPFGERNSLLTVP